MWIEKLSPQLFYLKLPVLSKFLCILKFLEVSRSCTLTKFSHLRSLVLSVSIHQPPLSFTHNIHSMHLIWHSPLPYVPPILSLETWYFFLDCFSQTIHLDFVLYFFRDKNKKSGKKAMSIRMLILSHHSCFSKISVELMTQTALFW